MKPLFRVLVSSVVVLATYYFVYWVPFSLIPLNGQRWIASVVSLFCGIGAGWFVWSRARSVAGTLISSVFYGAILLGAIGFSAGFFGPMFFSTSNLGPLLGIFVTGPVGALAGALWGMVRSAKNADASETRAILAWLSAVWVLTLLYTLFMIGLATRAALPAIGLQALIVGSSAFLLYRGNTRTRLSEPVHRCRPVAITTLALIMLMTVFPPVTRPWWVPKAAQEGADSTAPLPKVAFILDARFDASRHVPLFAVDRRVLVLEWVMSAIAALAVSQVMIRRRGRTRPDVGPPCYE